MYINWQFIAGIWDEPKLRFTYLNTTSIKLSYYTHAIINLKKNRDLQKEVIILLPLAPTMAKKNQVDRSLEEYL